MTWTELIARVYVLLYENGVPSAANSKAGTGVGSLIESELNAVHEYLCVQRQLGRVIQPLALTANTYEYNFPTASSNGDPAASGTPEWTFVNILEMLWTTSQLNYPDPYLIPTNWKLVQGWHLGIYQNGGSFTQPRFFGQRLNRTKKIYIYPAPESTALEAASPLSITYIAKPVWIAYTASSPTLLLGDEFHQAWAYLVASKLLVGFDDARAERYEKRAYKLIGEQESVNDSRQPINIQHNNCGRLMNTRKRY